jgi:hypothetical protein
VSETHGQKDKKHGNPLCLSAYYQHTGCSLLLPTSSQPSSGYSSKFLLDLENQNVRMAHDTSPEMEEEPQPEREQIIVQDTSNNGLMNLI